MWGVGLPAIIMLYTTAAEPGDVVFLLCLYLNIDALVKPTNRLTCGFLELSLLRVSVLASGGIFWMP